MTPFIDYSHRRLFQMLKNLKKNEISEFLLYLEAPHLAIKDEEKGFIRQVTLSHPNYDRIALSLIDELFEGNTQKMEKGIFKLLPTLENWLIYRELDKTPYLKTPLLAKVYSNYVSPDTFFTKSKSILAKLNTEDLINPDFFHTQFKISSTIFHHPDYNRNQIENPLESLSEQLDHYYTGEKLRLICQQFSRKYLLNEQINISFCHEVLAYAKQFPLNQYFQLYLKLIQLFQEKNPELVYEIKEQFDHNSFVFNRKEQAIYLHLLINYILVHNNRHDKKYPRLPLELYKLAINKDLLIFNRRIGNGLFFNIVSTSCKSGEIDFAKEFVKSYHSFLDQQQATQLLPLAKGLIAFHKKKYENCYDYIQNLNFKKWNFIIMHRALLIRCFYEMYIINVEWQLRTEHEIKTFKRYIKNRKKLTQLKKNSYINFANTVQKLINLKKEKSTVKFQLKVAAIEGYLMDKSTIIISKGWLIEKTNNQNKSG